MRDMYFSPGKWLTAAVMTWNCSKNARLGNEIGKIISKINHSLLKLSTPAKVKGYGNLECIYKVSSSPQHLFNEHLLTSGSYARSGNGKMRTVLALEAFFRFWPRLTLNQYLPKRSCKRSVSGAQKFGKIFSEDWTFTMGLYIYTYVYICIYGYIFYCLITVVPISHPYSPLPYPSPTSHIQSFPPHSCLCPWVTMGLKR